MIEVEVHSLLRAFLREQGNRAWPHHLTMARLVARALRLGRSALIQTGSPQSMGSYRLSYLSPALLWQGPVIVVAPESVQQRLIEVQIPQLQQWMKTDKAIITDYALPENFQGLLLTSPEIWLSDRLKNLGTIPTGIPTIFDGADELEELAREQLTVCLQPKDWDDLMRAFPHQTEPILDARVQLTKELFQHPVNPYECYLISRSEQGILQHLYESLTMPPSNGSVDRNADFITSVLGAIATDNGQQTAEDKLPPAWQNFWERSRSSNQLMWAEMKRAKGQFSLYCGPVEVATALEKIWHQDPVVLIGAALDLETEAKVYRQRVGLKDLTCIKFSPDRQNELIHLYLPDRLPFPNTPQFQGFLIQEVRRLIEEIDKLPVNNPDIHKLAVILVEDTPLRAQVAAALAGEFGSRVQVEKTRVSNNGILVTGWEFWRHHQETLPAPQLLVIATLPIPSLENPLVAGRVIYYKQQRQDWFRLYLLPVALSELQRAIAPVRESQGVVALLDSRVNHRSYGSQVLEALSPLARINYLDTNWFTGDR
ncbi:MULTISPECIES: ATP-dependent DNA helicase [Cyanophyceae]|uniref:ATP-dependent DNA helicase n=1 Tax=Cyanophyceae TaxID=3028117 RepID=UPI0016869C1C|nr:ATP-dependent DNA helicase [Trichocoleus sp. FACHB-40]